MLTLLGYDGPFSLYVSSDYETPYSVSNGINKYCYFSNLDEAIEYMHKMAETEESR